MFCSAPTIAAFGLILLGTQLPGTAGVRLEPAGQWGGCTYAVAIAGDRAYCGIGPRLVVLDLTDPANPTFLGQSEVLPCVVGKVALQGGYAYVADCYGGFQILDVADPYHPRRVGGDSFDGQAMDVAVNGEYAYVLDFYHGLRVYDVSDPTAPAQIGVWQTDDPASALAYADGYVYYVTWWALEIIDVSDPYQPVWMASGEFGFLEDIAVQDGYAFLAEYWTGLLVLDLAIPAWPVLVSACPVEDGSATAITVDGEYAWLGDGADVEAFDIGRPEAPVWRASINGLSRVQDLASNGVTLVVSEWYRRISTFEISDPAQPQALGAFDQVNHAHYASLCDGVALVDGYSAQMEVLEIGDPSAPQRAGQYHRTYGMVAVCESNMAYVACGPDGLDVVDVTDPAQPVRLGHTPTLGMALDVTLVNQHACVADHVAGLTVVDVSDPCAPVVAGTYDTGVAMAVASDRDLVYLIDADTGLHVFDVSSGTPTRLGGCLTTWPAYDLAVHGGFVYAAYSAVGGLDVIDVSEPTAPRVTGVCSLSSSCAVAGCLSCLGSYLFLAGPFQVNVLDVSDAAAPVPVFCYQTGNYSTGVSVAAGYAYIADDAGGLAVAAFHVPGDLNCDGFINGGDINPFVLALSDAPRYTAVFPRCHITNADCNTDGVVNFGDINPLVVLLVAGD